MVALPQVTVALCRWLRHDKSTKSNFFFFFSVKCCAQKCVDSPPLFLRYVVRTALALLREFARICYCRLLAEPWFRSLAPQISIPGAKRIRVVFDEKCSTEMGCDYVRIYKGVRLAW